jgi:hypothetical protein
VPGDFILQNAASTLKLYAAILCPPPTVELRMSVGLQIGMKYSCSPPPVGAWMIDPPPMLPISPLSTLVRTDGFHIEFDFFCLVIDEEARC